MIAGLVHEERVVVVEHHQREVHAALGEAHVLVTPASGLEPVGRFPQLARQDLELLHLFGIDGESGSEHEHGPTVSTRSDVVSTVGHMHVDLFAPATQEDWYPTYDHLRDHEPV